MDADVLRYRTGEIICVGDEVMEPVNGDLYGRVVEVLQSGSPEAYGEGYPSGGMSMVCKAEEVDRTFRPPEFTGFRH